MEHAVTHNRRSVPWEVVAFFVPFLVVAGFVFVHLWVFLMVGGPTGLLLPLFLAALAQVLVLVFFARGAWLAHLMLIAELAVLLFWILFSLGTGAISWPWWMVVLVVAALVLLVLPKPLQGLTHFRQRWGDVPRLTP